MPRHPLARDPLHRAAQARRPRPLGLPHGQHRAERLAHAALDRVVDGDRLERTRRCRHDLDRRKARPLPSRQNLPITRACLTSSRAARRALRTRRSGAPRATEGSPASCSEREPRTPPPGARRRPGSAQSRPLRPARQARRSQAPPAGARAAGRRCSRSARAGPAPGSRPCSPPTPGSPCSGADPHALRAGARRADDVERLLATVDDHDRRRRCGAPHGRGPAHAGGAGEAGAGEGGAGEAGGAADGDGRPGAPPMPTEALPPMPPAPPGLTAARPAAPPFSSSTTFPPQAVLVGHRGDGGKDQRALERFSESKEGVLMPPCSRKRSRLQSSRRAPGQGTAPGSRPISPPGVAASRCPSSSSRPARRRP